MEIPLRTVVGFIIGVISVIALYYYLLLTYEKLDLHHLPDEIEGII